MIAAGGTNPDPAEMARAITTIERVAPCPVIARYCTVCDSETNWFYRIKGVRGEVNICGLCMATIRREVPFLK